MALICALLRLYLLVILAAIISSWIPTSEGSLADRLVKGLRAATEPVFRPVRSLVPAVQLGGAALDLSPLIVLVVLQVVTGLIC